MIFSIQWYDLHHKSRIIAKQAIKHYNLSFSHYPQFTKAYKLLYRLWKKRNYSLKLMVEHFYFMGYDEY